MASLLLALVWVYGVWGFGGPGTADAQVAGNPTAGKSNVATTKAANAESANAAQTGAARDSADSPQKNPLPQAISPFALKDYMGQEHRLEQFQQPVVVVVFLGVGCPLAQLYGPRLQAIAEEFGADRVAVVGINANRQDSVTEMAAYARKHGVKFPLLKDAGNRIADQFEAERTPEAFVLDADRRVRYRGRIDDQYGVGYAREQAETHDLKNAISDLLAGREVKNPKTAAVGCHIGRIAKPDENSKVTYASPIAGILQRHCVECHREGEIAPFALTDYDEVAGWAETIEEVINDNRMPPWHADPKHGSFKNARRMTSEEKALIRDWVDAGAPLGDANKIPPTPAAKKSVWRTPREPDMVVEMRATPFRVPAEGTVEYQYFVVDPQFKEDKWVSAAEVIPGNRRVVHHAIVFIKAPRKDDLRGFGWLSAYVPGQALLSLPNGMARKIPAGSKLIFQMHYTPAGAVQEDITKIGLVFADPQTIKEEAFTMLVMNREFEIPPHASNHQVSASLDRFPKGGRLLAIAPHMHVRGKSFQFNLHHSDGRKETMLNVPNYDFNWQHSYTFDKPLELKPGMRIECIGGFDNSDGNLVNPDPTQEIRWGDQTWEEMMLGYLEVAAPRKQPRDDSARAQRQREAERSAEAFFKRFDKDGNGVVASRETTSAFSTFAFRRIDANNDRMITREEAIQAGLKKRKP